MLCCGHRVVGDLLCDQLHGVVHVLGDMACCAVHSSVPGFLTSLVGTAVRQRRDIGVYQTSQNTAKLIQKHSTNNLNNLVLCGYF